MFDAYCLFIYFLFIYFLCCKYRPFFSIFFYIIPTKICKILFFCKNPLFPSFFRSFLRLSSHFAPLFLLLCLLYPGEWVRCSSAASLSLLAFPLSFPSLSPSSLITPLSFGEGLGVRLKKARRHHPHSDAPTGFSHTFISGIAIVILFFISTNNLIINTPLLPSSLITPLSFGEGLGVRLLFFTSS